MVTLRQAAAFVFALLLGSGQTALADDATRGVEIVMKEPEIILRSLYEKSWAVVVGVNQYPHGGRSYPHLNYAVNDARQVADKLRDLGFEVKLLLDKDATRQNIIRALADEVGTNAKENDRVVFYFAGHGATKEKADKTNMGYILPHDYDPAQHSATAISMSRLREVSTEIKAKHMLYAMDSCFSGGLLTSRGKQPTQGAGYQYLSNITKTRAHVVITAGGRDQTVKEDDGSGVFTKILVEALSKKSRMPWSEDGYLTAMDLASYIKKRVPDLSPNQTPQYGTLDGEGDVVLNVFKPLDVSGGDERSHQVFEAERALQAEEALQKTKKKRNIVAPGF
jgi:uncharacterized caspase-like protein